MPTTEENLIKTQALKNAVTQHAMENRQLLNGYMNGMLMPKETPRAELERIVKEGSGIEKTQAQRLLDEQDRIEAGSKPTAKVEPKGVPAYTPGRTPADLDNESAIKTAWSDLNADEGYTGYTPQAEGLRYTKKQDNESAIKTAWSDLNADEGYTPPSEPEPKVQEQSEPGVQITPDMPVNWINEASSAAFSPAFYSALNMASFGGQGDQTGMASHLRNQGDQNLKSAADYQKAAQQWGQIANSDYRTEADKNAVAQATLQNAGVKAKMSSATSPAAAALAANVASADYNTHMNRQDAARDKATENNQKANDMRQLAEERYSKADTTDYEADQVRQRNLRSESAAYAGNDEPQRNLYEYTPEEWLALIRAGGDYGSAQ